MAEKKSQREDAPSKYRLAGLGLELAGAVIGGCAIGWFIDYRFGTRFGLLIGGIIGIVGGLYNLIKQSLSLIKDDSKQERDPQDHVGGDL